MTNKRYIYEKTYSTSNENDLHDTFYLQDNDFSSKNLTNENNAYSGMPLPTEMHYIPNNNNNNQIPYNSYNEEFQSFDTFDIEKKKFQDEILNQYNLMYDKLQEKYTNLTNKNLNQNQIIIKKLKNEIREMNDINQKQQSKIESQEQIINKLQQSLKNLENDKDELDIENYNLLQKNAKLENQLENFIQQNDGKFQIVDDEQNHIVILNSDISELNYKLKKFITNLKQDVVINIEKVKKLLLIYKCQTRNLNQKDDRLFIQAILQRHVIETIFEYANEYFKSTGCHYHLEADIIKNETLLSLLLSHSSKCRVGNDEVTRLGSTKLRQQIYSILNNRGFSDILGVDKATYEHPFITYNKGQLNKVINELRIIEDDQKKIASDNLAADIIREVIKIFWFRLKVQEPVVQYLWIPKDSKLDKSFMEGNNLDDNVNSTVDLCYFPLIGRDLNSNNRKIYFPAKVFIKSTSNV
ncbi:hypothetical protein C1645_809797 [Glomus cerebriforme]|uniref:Uncharacterized protein n=1 Tax=Glomus cerebriforme TaxID=658196 RepID=A0A397SCN4_9GLOM|nr:hypothetical protein C1645_809797 [Glomus cerebriforme]